MAAAYRHIEVQKHDDAACVRIVNPRVEENELHEMSSELLDLARKDGCKWIALSLGPQTPECLYSVFLARLISLQRKLREMGGGLKLCECTPLVIDILDACILLDRFDIVADPATALRQWGKAGVG